MLRLANLPEGRTRPMAQFERRRAPSGVSVQPKPRVANVLFVRLCPNLLLPRPGQTAETGAGNGANATDRLTG